MKYFSVILFSFLFTFCNSGYNGKPIKMVIDTTVKSISKDDSKLEEGKMVKFDAKYHFTTFKTIVFTGKIALPDFTDNDFSTDKKYVKFIKEGCEKNKINFGGHYTIIQKSCGNTCEGIFIVDRINGKIFTDIKPNDGRYGYLYKKDSRLLIANANIFQDSTLEYYNDFFGKPELYVWQGINFKLLQ